MYTLAPDIYAVRIGTNAVLLNTQTDEYLRLDTDATQVLVQAFASNQDIDSASGQQHPILADLCARTILLPQPSSTEATQQTLPEFVSPPGFFSANWRPAESVCADSRLPIPLASLFEAWLWLWRTRSILQRSYTKGLLRRIQSLHRRRSRGASHPPAYYAEAILRALAFFPFSVRCLVGSGALVSMLQAHGHRSAQLVIGVRDNPFYAHAWVEYNQIILNDAPDIQGHIGELLRVPDAVQGAEL